jgi:hypothetical protein
MTIQNMAFRTNAQVALRILFLRGMFGAYVP